MESGQYILGQEVEDFETEWAAYCGTRHCVAVASGLDALELTLQAWGVGPGDEVIVPSNAYIACWLAVTNVGATLAPVEPDASTSNLDPTRVEDALTARTKAVMAVHLYGRCVDLDRVLDIARRDDLKVLEDAAQAHGARYRGRSAGSLADAGAFSFYPTKNLGAFGDAGSITTDDPSVAERVRLLRNYGSERKYENRLRGRNSRLDPLQAAFLRVRLAHLDEWNERRRAAAERYTLELTGIPGLRLPPIAELALTVWHVYVVHHHRRDELQRELAADGIQTLVYYPTTPHLSEAYRTLGWGPGAFPVAEELARTNLALPIGPQMKANDQARVIAAVRRAASPLGS